MSNSKVEATFHGGDKPYTLTTNTVKAAFAATYGTGGGKEDAKAAFDRWLKGIKDEAYKDGYDDGASDVYWSE